MTDSILIVDDEDGVRRTMSEWLISSGLSVTATAVADAESALIHANTYPIDLAILDWNLGTGADGLRLLEDLVDFQPNLVAILVTGFAAQATPLHAMRMGVRDYLDKNADFTREAFLAAVKKQLAQIAPAKRQREIAAQLKQFRESVEQILPLIGGSVKFNEPVPLPDAIRSLIRFTVHMTGAKDGALVACRTPTDEPEQFVAYAADGTLLPGPYPAFSRSLLAAASAAGRPAVVTDFSLDGLGPVDLIPVEQNRRAILIAPFAVGPNVHVAMELFDKPEFTDADRATAATCAEIGTDLARMVIANRQSSRVLFEAVESALRAANRVGTPVATSIVDRLKSHFGVSDDGADSASLELIDAIRTLSLRHGPRAVAHCRTMVTDLSDLLDNATGAGP